MEMTFSFRLIAQLLLSSMSAAAKTEPGILVVRA